MIRIRNILAQEWAYLLEQLGAPDSVTLLRRAVFWGWFYCSCGIVLGGLVAVYVLFGMAAFWAAIGAVYLVYLATLRRTPVYFGDGSEFGLDLGGSAPTLPPGGAALPPSGTPQIGRASTALTPSRPGPVARR